MRQAYLLLAIILHAQGFETFEPKAFELHALLDREAFAAVRDSFEEELASVGVITITDIPDFDDLRTDALEGAHECLEYSDAAQTTVMDDGTARRTLGASTLDGVARPPATHGEGALAGCARFDFVQSAFRAHVATAIEAFAARLSEVAAPDADPAGSPLLLRAPPRQDAEPADGGLAPAAYATLADIVAHGEHLEHFHSYHKPDGARRADDNDALAIDFHTDQGLFIAFTPARTLAGNTSADAAEFLVEFPDGVAREARFGGRAQLVMLLGDGVVAHVNPWSHSSRPLRAAPHALRMPRSGQRAGDARLWYGRMVLPPPDALDGTSGNVTFGEQRELAQRAQQRRAAGDHAADAGGPLAVGCASGRVPRELWGTGCEDNQIYCWYRCMDETVDANRSYCAAQGLTLNCTSMFGQISDGNHHGDYSPACTDGSAGTVTPSPTIVPASASCSTGWDAFVDWGAYAAFVPLTHSRCTSWGGCDNQDAGYFLWNVVGDQIEGKIVHNGRLGYIAIGTENHGGGKNGMMVRARADPSSHPPVPPPFAVSPTSRTSAHV